MRLALVALLLAVAPSSALAQSADDVPPPPIEDRAPTITAPEASLDVTEELAAPTVDPYLPSGYRRPSSPEDASETRTLVHVLPWGEDDLTLHARARGSRAPYAALCTAPCRLRLEPGAYELAISPSGGGPRTADDQPIPLGRERTAIQLHYDHRSGLRVLGWVFLSMGATALALSALGGVFGVLLVGVPLFAACLIPFFVLAFLEDSARVQVIPLEE